MKGRGHQHSRHARRAELPQQDAVAEQLEARTPAQETVVSVVYVTASPTFTGSIAGYSTLGQDDATTTADEKTTSTTSKAKTTSSAKSSATQDASVDSSTTLKTSASTSSSDLPSSIVATSSVGSSLAILAATGSATSSQSVSATGSSSSASSTAASTSSSGMSAGGKAGLAIGILLLFGAALGLVLFCFKKKKAAAKQEQIDNEKSNGLAPPPRLDRDTRSTRTASTAPRLSLRPVTQFLPYNNTSERSEKQQAPAQMRTFIAVPGTPTSTYSERPITNFSGATFSERPITALPPPPGQEQNKINPFGNHASTALASPLVQEQNRTNPFGNHAEERPTANFSSERPITTLPSDSSQNQDQVNPFGNHAETIDTNANAPTVGSGMIANESMIPDSLIVAGAAAGAMSPSVNSAPAPLTTPVSVKPATGLARGASKRENNKPKDFTKTGGAFKGPPGPPSPTASEFSNTSESTVQTATGVAFNAAGGPPGSAVHRVQLDFVPSMDDELELQAGDLIRVLHEYDDGWALCIRLDRSKQGVVPRTCLSTRPVKPRLQQNGPRGHVPPRMQIPQQRPMSPGMNQGTPRTTNGQMLPYPSSPSSSRMMTPNGPPNGQGIPRGPGMMQGPPRSGSPSGNRQMNGQGQQQRPMTPQGQRPPQGRPMTPQGQQQRPMTPQGQQQRPMTPQSHASQIPVANGRSRSGSVAQGQPRQPYPTGPSSMIPTIRTDGSNPAPYVIRSPVERKPVPGQAL